MKRLTLNETWKLCLAMWKWIAGQVKKDDILDIEVLKEQWLEEHGFSPNGINEWCFFCEYAIQHDGCRKSCPGKMVNPLFSCTLCSTYHYYQKPIAFYNKLVSLNRKRKKK